MTGIWFDSKLIRREKPTVTIAALKAAYVSLVYMEITVFWKDLRY